MSLTLSKPKFKSKQSHEKVEELISDFQSPLKSTGIARELLPLFDCLRILGRCPLISETTEDTQGFQKIHYKLNFCFNSKFLFSAFVSIFVSLCCILHLIHNYAPTSVFGNLWPTWQMDPLAASYKKNLRPITRLILNSFQIIMSLMVVIEYIIAWLTSPTLAKWLNNWNEIDNDFKKTFGAMYDPDLSKIRKLFALPYVIIPTIMFGGGLLFLYLDLEYPIGAVIVTISCFTACYQTEDVKVILMFKAIESSFRQIRKSVQIRYQKRTTRMVEIVDVLEIEEIQSWQRILILIRNQAELVGEYLAVHQLLSIASLVYLASSTLFIFSNMFGQSDGESFVFSYAFLVIVVFITVTNARLFIKIFKAVQITKEERRLAHLLKDLEFLEDNLDCKQEVKKIHGMLVQCPTEISLNNYVSLNNSLILSICAQVLAQYVVLMQFLN